MAENDPSLTELYLVNNNTDHESEFYSESSDGYSALGTAIANNTHLEDLIVILSDGQLSDGLVRLSDRLPLDVANRAFYDGLKHNSSIHGTTI